MNQIGRFISRLVSSASKLTEDVRKPIAATVISGSRERELARWQFEMMILLGMLRSLDAKMLEFPKHQWDNPVMHKNMARLQEQLSRCIEDMPRDWEENVD